jgi:serine/threonine-protein kinase
MVLGHGGYGWVFASWNRLLNRAEAIKVLHASQDPCVTLLAEAQSLARLDHPHIVRVYHSPPARGLCLFTMELLDGGTLSKRPARPLPETACAIALAVAEALAHAHHHGLLHLDIKPDNILFTATAIALVKVADFGIARLLDESPMTTGKPEGMADYMAPEQLAGGHLGVATDVYALALVLYEQMAGHVAFDPFQPELRITDPAPALPPDVSSHVAEVVARALATRPADRQPTAHAFAMDLAHAAARSYGPDWMSRAKIDLRLSNEVYEAARGRHQSQ